MVGVVAATIEAVLLNQKSVSQLLPTAKANRSNLHFVQTGSPTTDR